MIQKDWNSHNYNDDYENGKWEFYDKEYIAKENGKTKNYKRKNGKKNNGSLFSLLLKRIKNNNTHISIKPIRVSVNSKNDKESKIEKQFLAIIRIPVEEKYVDVFDGMDENSLYNGRILIEEAEKEGWKMVVGVIRIKNEKVLEKVLYAFYDNIMKKVEVKKEKE